MNQKSSWVLILAISIFLNSCAFILSNTSPKTVDAAPSQKGQTLPITAKADVKGQVIELEVAQTPEQQAIGLMFRDSLADNRGMLFLFPQPQLTSFWMKNVSIPLDMIFLYQGQVKAIVNSVPPCTTNPCPIYGPNTIIDQVIELKGGRAKELGLKVDEVISVEFLTNRNHKD